MYVIKRGTNPDGTEKENTMKKQNLNFLYDYIKRECDLYKNAYNPTAEWKAVMLHGVYKAAYEYVRDGGKRDVDKIINAATKK